MASLLIQDQVGPPVGTLGEELVGVREVTCMVRNASLTNHMVGSRPARIPNMKVGGWVPQEELFFYAHPMAPARPTS